MQYGANKPSWHRSSTVENKSFADIEAIQAVKNALGEFPLQQQVALQRAESGIEREEILDADICLEAIS